MFWLKAIFPNWLSFSWLIRRGELADAHRPGEAFAGFP
jgi:hypothetical protein